ncbi:MAG: hypothetical protein ACYC69_09955 [Thermodesulfovibrionales bacterium]
MEITNSQPKKALNDSAAAVKGELLINADPDSKIFDPTGTIPIERQEALFDVLRELGINIHLDEWPFADLVDVKIHRDSQYTYKFGLSATASKYRDGFGWLKPFMKGFIADLLSGGRTPMRIYHILALMRPFYDFIRRAEINDLSEVTLGVIARYENEVNQTDFADSTKYEMFTFLRDFLKFMNTCTDWQPPVMSYYNHKSTVAYYQSQKKKLLPDEVMNQLSATAGRISRAILADNYVPSWDQEQDLFAAGALILAVGTRTRIAEVLSMGVDVELETEIGNFAIVMLKGKDKNGFILEPKPVEAQYVETIKAVLAAIKKVTAPYREYATYWEKKGKVHMIQPSQPLSKSLFCYYKVHSRPKEGNFKRLTRDILDGLWRGESMARKQFAEAVKINFGWFSSKFKVDRGTLIPLSELCQIAFQGGYSITYDMFSRALKKFCIRYQITYRGKPYCINSHQLRHLTTTKMLNAGAPMVFTDEMHGRSTTGQSTVYDHPTDAERRKRAGDVNQSLQKILGVGTPALTEKDIPVVNIDRHEFAVEAIARGHFTGPRAVAIRRLRERFDAGEIGKGELDATVYQLMGDVTLSPNGAGLCVQNRFERPCEHAHSCFVCITNDYEPCNKLMPLVSLSNLELLQFHERETAAAMKNMQANKAYLNAAELPYWESRFEFQQKKLRNIKQIQHDVRVQLEYRDRTLIEETKPLPGAIDD